uniref:dihydrofolate reductase n=1 Tax=Echeneis naucrates TaxID=173247 RepID=A0A665UUC1_ECHNA
SSQMSGEEISHYFMKPMSLMVAACNNMGIRKHLWLTKIGVKYLIHSISGKMNLLLWGRVTWYAHPESTFPLPNALHAVLSNTLTTVPDHAHFLCKDFDDVVRLAGEPPLADLIETIWVIGGAVVYKEALSHPWCDLIYLTHIMANFDCDVFFPDFDREQFILQESFPGVPSGVQEENGIKYKCQVFKKMIGDAV